MILTESIFEILI